MNQTGIPAWHRWLSILHCLCSSVSSIPSLVQWVKDLALLQQWLKFDPWPEIFHMLPSGKKKKKERKRERKKQPFFWLHFFGCSWISALGIGLLVSNFPFDFQRWKIAPCPLKEERVEQKHLVMLVFSSTELRVADPLELIKINAPNNERPGSPGNRRNCQIKYCTDTKEQATLI